jgi:2-desacetyl-2-hydroxyethyl bacteriochlorophyllide A dehydrogenase
MPEPMAGNSAGAMMRALVVDAPDRYGLREVDAPACGADDVLVRSVAAAMCGTDLKIMRGAMPPGVVSYPCIPGHEWSGVVEAVGEGVVDVDAGDRVVCEPVLRCGRCVRCRAGETNLCENFAQLGFTRPGGFGAFVAVPARVVHRLPDAVGSDAAALAEPLACVVHAFERGGIGAGHAVAIVGSGGLGSLAILLARHMRARRVIAYGVTQTELALARGLGADEVHGPGSAGEAADVTLETSGAPEALRTAVAATRRGGRVVLLGTGGEGTALTFHDDEIVRRELDVLGSLSSTAGSWETSLRLIADGAVDVGLVITHRFPIARYETAMHVFDERTEPVGRIILEHET